jgi:hypothetical protein
LEDPNTKPQPLATLHVSVPTLIPWGAASAVPASATAPIAKAAAPIIKRKFFCMVEILLFRRGIV